jgi:hypothetical protein
VSDGAFTDALFTTEAMNVKGGGIFSSLECEE